MTGLSSLQVLCQMVLLPGTSTAPVPPSKEAVAESDPGHLVGDVTGHQQFGFMPDLCVIEVGREIGGMLECIPSAPRNLQMIDDAYSIATINAYPEFSFFPLDNTPEVELNGEWFAQRTSLSEAFSTMRKICAEKKFAPLDLHSFGAWLQHDHSRFANLLKRLKVQHGREGKASKVTLLFADPIQVGECQEEHCVILEVAEDFSRGELRVVDADRRLCSLHEKETVIGIFVKRKWVEIDVSAEHAWFSRGKGTSFKPASLMPTGKFTRKAAEITSAAPDAPVPPAQAPDPSVALVQSELDEASPWLEIVRENVKKRGRKA